MSAILVIQVGVLEKLDIIQKSRTEVNASIEANECVVRDPSALCGTGAGCSLRYAKATPIFCQTRSEIQSLREGKASTPRAAHADSNHRAPSISNGLQLSHRLRC